MKADRERLIVSFMMISITIAPFAHTQEQKAIKQTADLSRLVQCVPDPAYKLSQWPSPSVLSGPNRLKNDVPEVAYAKKQCSDWVRKAVAPSWLPPEDVQPIFIRAEFDGRDTVRMAWERNGFAIQVSQTASIFTMKLTPLGDSQNGVDPVQKLQYARSLCTKAFSETGYRWAQDASGTGVKVPIKDLSQKIASYSFQPEFARDLADDHAVWGRPQTRQETAIKPPQNEAEALRQRDPNNPDWDNTTVSYMYWFRMVNWWNDGKTVGFYFLKVEEGSWSPSYNPTIDDNFFRI